MASADPDAVQAALLSHQIRSNAAHNTTLRDFYLRDAHYHIRADPWYRTRWRLDLLGSLCILCGALLYNVSCFSGVYEVRWLSLVHQVLRHLACGTRTGRERIPDLVCGIYLGTLGTEMLNKCGDRLHTYTQRQDALADCCLADTGALRRIGALRHTGALACMSMQLLQRLPCAAARYTCQSLHMPVATLASSAVPQCSGAIVKLYFGCTCCMLSQPCVLGVLV